MSNTIDGGRSFDFGAASADYAKYRDIYPGVFFDKILSLGMCGKGRRVLDLGTGTGVLPRLLHGYGGVFTGTDISPEQIKQAETLSEGMGIKYICSPAESLSFPDGSFDDITACQCFFYFDHNRLAYKLSRMLTESGKLAVLYMGFLPREDRIIAESERLIYKYNPSWSGGGETRHKNYIPDVYGEYFDIISDEVFDIDVPFTREGWNGRIKACRGIGAELSREEVERFGAEHMKMLEDIAPESFTLKHFAAVTVMEKHIQ